MYQKILVPMDMSAAGEVVFSQALSLAQSNHAQMRLLHILSSEEENSPLPIPANLKEIYPAAGNDLTVESWRQQWVDFERKGLETLEKRQKIAFNAGISADYQQIQGNPGRKICQVANEWQADLIVIGHRGLSGLTEMLLGSVSNYVLHHAVCSVLIVQLPKV